jgi:hypothetical protein
VLVGVPQRSKFGGSGAEFGGSWGCDIAESATSLIGKLVFGMGKTVKFIQYTKLYTLNKINHK